MTTLIDWVNPRQWLPRPSVAVLVALADGTTNWDQCDMDTEWIWHAQSDIVAWAHFPPHGITTAPPTLKDITAPARG